MREGTERQGPGQCPSGGCAARAWDDVEPFKTQNATGGEIKKNSKGKKKGKRLDGGKRNRKAHDNEKSTTGWMQKNMI